MVDLIGTIEGVTRSDGYPWRAIWIDGFLPDYERLKDTERKLIEEGRVSPFGRKRAARDRLFRKLLVDLVKDYQTNVGKESCFSTIYIVEGIASDLQECHMIENLFVHELLSSTERKREEDYRHILGVYNAEQCYTCPGDSYYHPLCLRKALKELDFDIRKLVREAGKSEYSHAELRQTILKGLEDIYNYPARLARKRLEYLGFKVKQEIFFE